MDNLKRKTEDRATHRSPPSSPRELRVGVQRSEHVRKEQDYLRVPLDRLMRIWMGTRDVRLHAGDELDGAARDAGVLRAARTAVVRDIGT